MVAVWGYYDLMIWNAGKALFVDFLYLFPASFIGWLVTCYLLSLSVPNETVRKVDGDGAHMKGVYTFGSHMRHAWTVVIGFLASVAVWYLQFEVLAI